VIPSGIDPELFEAFLAETSDILVQSERTLLEFERQPRDPAPLSALLRDFHTLKGAAAAVGLAEVATHLHRGETLLQELQAGTVPLDDGGRLADFLFRFTDSVRALIAEAGGLADDDHRVLRDLEEEIAALGTPLPAAADEPEPSAGAGEECSPTPVVEAPAAAFSESETAEGDAATLRIPGTRVDALLQRVGELLAQRTRIDGTARRFSEVRRRLDSSRRRLGAVLEGFPDRDDPVELARSALEASAEARDVTSELGNLVRELGLQLHHLSQTTGTLQRQITRLRLVPLETIFRRFSRTVRDAARLEGKRIDLQIQGADVQVDRLTAEALYPPLLHLVRNAVSHGIESPARREQQGKPAIGLIRLSARPRYNRVVITVADDGAGLNYEAILAKARAQDLVPAGIVPQREQLLSLIFRPGFTTEDAVTEISGRGVGLDVVAREVAALKGTVVASSDGGPGTTFRIAVPTTASIEEVALVEVGQQCFALPTDFMEHSLLVDAAALEKLRSRRLFDFRGQRIPVLFLAPLVSEAVAAEGAVVTILRALERTMALVVARVRAKEEVMVRPLGRVLEAHPFLSGATITASGEVIFVVNVARLFDVLTFTSIHAAAADEELATRRGPSRDLPDRGVLLVDDSRSVRMLASQYLAAERIDTETAVDGIDALEKLASSSFRVVVTDLEMPRLHGYELLAAIKRDPRWAHVPVIVCTSRSSEKHQKRALELGADAYIVKPFTKDQLCGEVLRVMTAG
jgi:chemosensory pili system protein ChpA (sensor histidine kinase/response regulator)